MNYHSKEWAEARREYLQAWSNFEHAEPAFVDVAVLRLKAAEEKMSALIRQMKEVSA